MQEWRRSCVFISFLGGTVAISNHNSITATIILRSEIYSPVVLSPCNSQAVLKVLVFWLPGIVCLISVGRNVEMDLAWNTEFTSVTHIDFRVINIFTAALKTESLAYKAYNYIRSLIYYKPLYMKNITCVLQTFALFALFHTFDMCIVQNQWRAYVTKIRWYIILLLQLYFELQG